MNENTVKYSVIVLLEEQHEDFAQFVQNLYDLFSSRQESFEIMIMANGTGGFLRNELSKLQNCNDKLKAYELNTKTPQAVCLKAVLKESSGDIIVVCGSYQQLTTADLGRLLDSLDPETDIISPWRKDRVDPLFNQFQSRLFNALVRWIIGSKLHDLNCTVKIFRREALEEIEIYGNMYLFLPVLATRKGFKTKEIGCTHYQERGKTGFYPLSSYLTRLIDIFTLYFNTRFTRKPLRFFSTIGLLFLLSGLLILSYVFIQKLLLGYPIGGRAVLLLAILCMVLGVQAASVGLLGEIVVFIHGRQRQDYTIEKVI
jgi:hypothetical protein